MSDTWARDLAGQLEFYWEAHLAPRLEGVTDDEYLWEPVAGCWSLRPLGDGRWRYEDEPVTPGPGPVTTIAWRMTHLSVEIFESRYRAFFAGEGPNQWAPGDRILRSGELPSTADDAVTYLRDAYQRWLGGIRGLTDAELARPLGPLGADFADDSMAQLVLHINREVMHHGAEVCLLRDLYAASEGGRRWSDRPGSAER